MDKQMIEELAMAVALREYCDGVIESAKDIIRNLSDEEIREINKTTMLLINRKSSTKHTYSAEYNKALAEIKQKYPATSISIPNHSITLTTTGYTDSRRDIIVNEVLTLNKTELDRILRSRR